MKILNKSEIDQFNKRGVLIKRKLLNKILINKILKEINSVKFKDNKKIYNYYDNSLVNPKESILVRTENFYKNNKILSNLIDNSLTNSILFELLNGSAILFKEKINYKPPGSKADKLHQDSQAGWNKFTKNFINVLISIEKSNLKNGCLVFDFSGNNSKRLISKKMKPLKKNDLKNHKFKKVPLNQGDVVFFNSYVPHCSSSNKSKNSRIQIYLTYSKKSEGNFRKKYIREKLKTFPPNNLRDPKRLYSFKV